MKVRSPNWQADPRYGTADWPAPIQTPNHNGPNATSARTIQAPDFDPSDTRPFADRILDQQWRDAVALGLLADIPLSINGDAPGESTGAGLFPPDDAFPVDDTFPPAVA